MLPYLLCSPGVDLNSTSSTFYTDIWRHYEQVETRIDTLLLDSNPTESSSTSSTAGLAFLHFQGLCLFGPGIPEAPTISILVLIYDIGINMVSLGLVAWRSGPAGPCYLL